MDYKISDKTRNRIDEITNKFYNSLSNILSERNRLREELVEDYEKRIDDKLSNAEKITILYDMSLEEGLELFSLSMEEDLFEAVKQDKHRRIRKEYEKIDKQEFGGFGYYYDTLFKRLIDENPDYKCFENNIKDLSKETLNELKDLSEKGLDEIMCRVDNCVIRKSRTVYEVNHSEVKRIILEDMTVPLPESTRIKAYLNLKIRLSSIISFDTDEDLDYKIRYPIKSMDNKIGRIWIKRKFNEIEKAVRIEAPDMIVKIL